MRINCKSAAIFLLKANFNHSLVTASYLRKALKTAIASLLNPLRNRRRIALALKASLLFAGHLFRTLLTMAAYVGIVIKYSLKSLK